ncbi:MAG: nodulation protein NfeD [Acidobacteria bacterium]|nr:nodulation protein NfeD [Acidobacteriota bacterium]
MSVSARYDFQRFALRGALYLGVLLAFTLVVWRPVVAAVQSPAPDKPATAGARNEGAGPPAAAPLVLVAHVDALIHPVSAEFMVEAISQADARGAALLIFTLDTPGGLVESMRAIITRMLAAKTPIAVFVAPSGARAASAGFLITIAADVAAMAPGTHMGAAHPVSGQGEKMDETVAKKAASDVAADARTIAAGRGRNVPLSEQAVNDSRAFTETEALNAVPPLVDMVATDVPDLLRKLEGWEIQRFDRTRTPPLHVAGARVEVVEMSLRQRILGTLAHPNIAYILLSLGVLGLTIELWSPGAVLPGVVGGICLLLAFFTFQILPVNYAGVLLMLFGVFLLILEIKVISYGVLAAGGIVSLLLGSMILIDSPTPGMGGISLGLIVPVVLALSAILLFLVRLAVISQRRRPVTGADGMIGEHGTTLTAIPAGGEGQISVHGETWTARSREAVETGERVCVTGINGLTATVSREGVDKELLA